MAALPDAIHVEPSPRARRAVGFTVSVHLDMAAIAGWKPERIHAFFGGLAQVVAASKQELEKMEIDADPS